MRTEGEMLDLILRVARDDGRVRAVAMNGSRADPSAPRDIFQDYDIVYVVTSVDGLLADRAWIDRFGERIIMQTPDEMGAPAGRAPGDPFAFLMLFCDGNRIDLTLCPLERLAALEPAGPTRVLLDPDRLLAPLSLARGGIGLPRPPAPAQFADCCNEFWWVSTYVAKGLWRRELPYAQDHHNGPVRAMLVRMLGWSIGVRHGFRVDAGKSGRNLERLLPPAWWRRLVATYAGGDCDDLWRALFAACDLFRDAAAVVGGHMGFPYPAEDDRRVSAHLRHVRDLPPDAAAVY